MDGPSATSPTTERRYALTHRDRMNTTHGISMVEGEAYSQKHESMSRSNDRAVLSSPVSQKRTVLSDTLRILEKFVCQVEW